jgi:hypothetical protein
VILRRDIRNLRFVRGSTDAKPHFELELEPPGDPAGPPRIQQIFLPGLFGGGSGAVDLAIKKLRDEGLLL